MKRILFIFFAVVCMNNGVKAAAGDTTWVQANNVWLTYYNNYDTAISFPAAGTTYRKVLMIFTLGKYVCPGSPTYCGDWDYTVQNFVMTPTDTFELGRLITPYANAGAPRTPFTWTQHYVYDITDYAGKLHGSAVMRILFSGYSGGFTGNIRFAFIEGTPERNVLDIKRPWHGSFNFGDSAGINSHLPAYSQTAPAGTVSADMKFTVTGHGSDANGCSEFCSQNYDVMVNGSSVATETIWRNNCGKNELYPQSGTWVYDRGNWCPGAIVYSHRNTLPGITSGTSFTTGIQFPPYTGSGASYTTEAALIYYGAINKTVDASIDNIIAPNLDENYYRENPICGKPIIHVRNTGATAITAMDITYGVQGATMHTYPWTGSIASLTETDITLPELTEIGDVAGIIDTNTFVATITTVNGAADNDVTNNTLTSRYANAALWPTTLKVYMTTNNEPVTTGSTVSETSWAIYDMTGAVVASRANAQISTAYIDTVHLGNACYRLVIFDSGCNGLHWWANPSSTTSGSFSVRKLTGAALTLHGYPTSGTYANDFGCGFSQYFKASDWTAAIDELTENTTNLSLFPNPAQNSVTVDIAGVSTVNGVIKVIDALGREVVLENCTTAQYQLNTARLVNGVYTIQYIDNANPDNKMQARVIIAK